MPREILRAPKLFHPLGDSDILERKQLLSKAAAGSHSGSQAILGLALILGNSVARDIPEGKLLFQVAAANLTFAIGVFSNGY
jgi:putative Ca2+/H+ antiporter (TMEM165/GDT1 family)